ncbi:LysM domain-containing protein [Phanerochaete sordida]|uniref:LysM domain-containing protein n=1 Tax=Phanerochaete sordida TaxID=48140 RepID=A0A9P3GB65_9APHY|nr:LysM domain-containing protein [Phanerochaete sordida]
MFAFAPLVALAVLAVVSAAPSAAAVPPDCARTYVVQQGDTCNSIGAAHQAPTFQIEHVNTQIDGNCDNLTIGDTLCLGRNGQDCSNVHVVKGGETCGGIARNANIALNVLFQNNPTINSGCTNIQVGEVLCTQSTVIHYT